MYKDQATYYPVNEMHTQLIPVTVGCAHNKCAFCYMYENCTYEEVSINDIDYELKYGNEYTEKVFLTGADPMHIGFAKLEKILKLIKLRLPRCACVACYASVRTIYKYTVEELSALHELGLRLLYIGFERGDDEVLKFMKKGHTVDMALTVAKKLNDAHIPFNTIIMYGLAGKGKCVEHAQKTAALVNQFKSNKIVTMNLTLFDSTPLAAMARKGEFVEASNAERVDELRELLKLLDPPGGTILDTTHPTNNIKLMGQLPDDREKLQKQLEEEA